MVYMETVPLRINFPYYEEYAVFDIIQLPRKGILLEIPWLWASNPSINWRIKILQWEPGKGLVNKQENTKLPLRESKVQRIIIYIKQTSTESAVIIPNEYLRYDKLFKEKLDIKLP